MKRAAALLAIAALLAVPAAALAAEPFSAQLTGDAEVPPVTTDGSGSANVTISDDENSISFEVTFEGLSGDGTATMAHIHVGPADDVGPPILWLSDCCAPGSFSSPLSGTLTEADLTPAGGIDTWEQALQAIRDGNTYVNVHTGMHPGGEIRGQLMAVEAPDTATAEQPLPGAGWTVLLAVLGLAVLLLATRQFAIRRA
jgi:hypothetical protein